MPVGKYAGPEGPFAGIDVSGGPIVWVFTAIRDSIGFVLLVDFVVSLAIVLNVLK